MRKARRRSKYEDPAASPRQGGEVDLESIIDRTAVPLLLVLDQVQDPHNLGACLRTAEAAGVNAVISTRDGSCGITDAVRRVAAGAAEHIPFIRVTNLARTLRQIKELGIWVTGTADGAEAEHFRVDFTVPSAIVMGAEGSGLRKNTREHCDHLVRIPMAGHVSCLNVSVATGVLLFEVVRQRLAKSG